MKNSGNGKSYLCMPLNRGFMNTDEFMVSVRNAAVFKSNFSLNCEIQNKQSISRINW